MLGTVVLLITGRKNMGHNRLSAVATCIVAAIAVTIYQMIQPQALITCLVPTFVILGAYLNMEVFLDMRDEIAAIVNNQ